MAQNISILEGGTAQQFGQVNKLKIANSGGGTSLWVPEDEVNTKSLHVDSNGTYYASQDECYGYDEVSVNIIDECFGYDDDGNLWDVDVDDDGFLTETELPVEIRVVQPPRKTKYKEGEEIKLQGIAVKAYMADGSEYPCDPQHNNVISIFELSIEPTEAHPDPEEGEGSWTPPSSLSPPFPSDMHNTLKKCSTVHWEFEKGEDSMTAEMHGDVSTAVVYGSSSGRTNSVDIVAASLDDPNIYVKYTRSNGWESIAQGHQESRHGKTFYVAGGGWWYYTDEGDSGNIPNITQDDLSSGYSASYWAYAMLFGEFNPPKDGTITVSWTHPDAIEPLTTTFQIEVEEADEGEGGNGGGGSSGGSW